MQHPPLFDPGLQPERTALAWRRTTVSLIVGALVSLRILPQTLGQWTFVIGFGGLIVAGILWRQSSHRARLTTHCLREGRALPDATLPLQVGATVSAAGVLALIFVLH